MKQKAGKDRARVAAYLTTTERGKALPDEIQARMLDMPDGTLSQLGFSPSDGAPELEELGELFAQLEATRKKRAKKARTAFFSWSTTSMDRAMWEIVAIHVVTRTFVHRHSLLDLAPIGGRIR